MGLTDINYTYSRREGAISILLENYAHIEKIGDQRYVLQKKDNHWIDLLIPEDKILSIRVTLSNPFETMFPKLIDFFEYLLSEGGGGVRDEHEEKIYKKIDELAIQNIENSYQKMRKMFQDMYPGTVLAVGTEEFYKIMFPEVM